MPGLSYFDDEGDMLPPPLVGGVHDHGISDEGNSQVHGIDAGGSYLPTPPIASIEEVQSMSDDDDDDDDDEAIMDGSQPAFSTLFPSLPSPSLTAVTTTTLQSVVSPDWQLATQNNSGNGSTVDLSSSLFPYPITIVDPATQELLHRRNSGRHSRERIVQVPDIVFPSTGNDSAALLSYDTLQRGGEENWSAATRSLEDQSHHSSPCLLHRRRSLRHRHRYRRRRAALSLPFCLGENGDTALWKPTGSSTEDHRKDKLKEGDEDTGDDSEEEDEDELWLLSDQASLSALTHSLDYGHLFDNAPRWHPAMIAEGPGSSTTATATSRTSDIKQQRVRLAATPRSHARAGMPLTREEGTHEWREEESSKGENRRVQQQQYQRVEAYVDDGSDLPFGRLDHQQNHRQTTHSVQNIANNYNNVGHNNSSNSDVVSADHLLSPRLLTPVQHAYSHHHATTPVPSEAHMCDNPINNGSIHTNNNQHLQQQQRFWADGHSGERPIPPNYSLSAFASASSSPTMTAVGGTYFLGDDIPVQPSWVIEEQQYQLQRLLLNDHHLNQEAQGFFTSFPSSSFFRRFDHHSLHRAHTTNVHEPHSSLSPNVVSASPRSLSSSLLLRSPYYPQPTIDAMAPSSSSPSSSMSSASVPSYTFSSHQGTGSN